MTEFSTTRSSGSAVQACPEDCVEAMNIVQDDVDRIARLDGPIERNLAITNAYEQVGAGHARKRLGAACFLCIRTRRLRHATNAEVASKGRRLCAIFGV